MILCVCNNVSERVVRQALQAGLSTITELSEQLDVGTCCGKCKSCVKQVIREVHGAKPRFPTPSMSN